MGTHHLQRYDHGDFLQWLARNGFTDELDFWSSLSGLNGGSVTDHMVEYLSSLGYDGNPSDQFAQFLKDQAAFNSGVDGTRFDHANKFYEGTYPPPSGTGFDFVSGDPWEFVGGGNVEPVT